MRKLPEYVTEEEVKKILDKAKNPKHYLIIRLLWETGVRVGELVELQDTDIDLDEGVIRVTSKKKRKSGRGYEKRVIPLQEDTIPLIRSYRGSRKKRGKYFIQSKQRNRMTVQGVWKIVRQYTKIAGIKKNVHPHTFRHGCLTHILKKTNNLQLVQEIAGHENITTTTIYTHLDTSFKKESLDGIF